MTPRDRSKNKLSDRMIEVLSVAPKQWGPLPYGNGFSTLVSLVQRGRVELREAAGGWREAGWEWRRLEVRR